jgi:D-lactate dehydrogenase
VNIIFFSSKAYDQQFFTHINEEHQFQHQLTFLPYHLSQQTVSLAKGYDAVCCFVNDQIDATVLKALNELNINCIILRCAGYNNVDLATAQQLDFTVCNVPEYSPFAVAEHATALILDLNRNIHRAHNRIRENNYALDGLLGFDLHRKVVGVIGAGKIGQVFIRIMRGFGCFIRVYDPHIAIEFNDKYIQQVDLATLLAESDIISLHCPLTPDTHHLINTQTLQQMKLGAMLINTSRGGLIDTRAVINALKTKRLGYLGIDVYEEEADIFFEDLSNTVVDDDLLARLQTFPNVVITGHQAFFTREALTNIAKISLENAKNFERGRWDLIHQVKVKVS